MLPYLANEELVPFVIRYGIAFVALLVGSITDLKTREVPDWVNYGLIICGVALNLLFSVVLSKPMYIINSLIGLAVFFGIAYIMFYAGQWGGGDSKMLMGLGSIIGLGLDIKKQFIPVFFINILWVGAVYGMVWSVWLAVKNRKRFLREFRKILSGKTVTLAKKIILAMIITTFIAAFFVQNYIGILVLTIAFIVAVIFYVIIFIRAVEKASMYKLVEPSKLTEGDWIVHDIIVKGSRIAGPKDLGVEKSQIKKLVELYRRRKIKKILIKEGIPFIPSFFIAFLVTLLFGNIVGWIV